MKKLFKRFHLFTIVLFAVLLISAVSINIVWGWTAPNGNPPAGSNNQSLYLLNGNIGIATSTPGYPLTVQGSVKIGGATSTLIFPDGTTQATAASSTGGGTTISAANVSSGSFGFNTGGGNYSFPASLSVSTTTAPSGGVAFFNGNVGINTTAPGSALDISKSNLTMVLGSDDNATTRTNSTTKVARVGVYPYSNAEKPNTAFMYVNSGTTADLYFGGGSGTMNAATDIRFYTAATTSTVAGTERMTIDTSGNVGIGTTAPAQTFHVQKVGGEYFQFSTGASGRPVAKLGASTNVGAGLVFNTFGTDQMSIYADNTRLDILSGGFVESPTATSQFHITKSNGYVGIGTTSPLSALQIGSTASGNSRIGGGSYSEYWITETYPRVFLSRDGAASGVSALQFGVGSTPVDTTIQRLPSGPGVALMGGNIGIGTTAPGYTLDVNGSVRATGYIYGNTITTTLGNLTLDTAIHGGDIVMGASYITVKSGGSVGIGTAAPAARLDVAGGNIISEQVLYARHIDGKGWADNSTVGDLYLQYNNTANNTFINSRGGAVGIGTTALVPALLTVGNSNSGASAIYGRGRTAVEGDGFSVGGSFTSPNLGIYTTSCSGCSVLAEMVPVAEAPINGDIMCTNPETGKTEVCKEDKSDYIKGIAQKYAETVMRMGCSDTLDLKSGKNSMHIGVMNADAWKEKPECNGWYPIALSGLSEETNVVCKSPKGKQLGYGDILVTSSVPGHLRPIDKGESVEAYQIAGKVDSICEQNKETDSIKVWIK